MNVSAPFIKRPIATSLLAAALLLAGVVAFGFLPVSPLPRVDFPTIQVSAGLPGASPETMASAVATPLERRFGRIAGVSEITSSSALGSTSLTLQFDLDRDLDAAARDVQAAINAAAGDLPPNLPTKPRYMKVNPADSPILILSLTSSTLPIREIYEQANTILAQRIAQVSGVGQVFVGGGQQPAVRVQVDPRALAGVHLSLADVRGVVSTATADEPKGVLSGQERLHTVAANDQIFTADAYRGLLLAHSPTGDVRLGDVARVSDDVENNRVAAWVDDGRGIIVVIRRQPGANILEVIQRVRDLLPTLATSISPAIKVSVCLDRATTIRASVKDVEFSLLASVLLVVLVVFAFLRSGWATTIPSVAVPLSLIGTFGVMYLCGYSLDNLSLMALTISTGFVVDDAIVVTENVQRFIEKGWRAGDAALEGARQIGFTIISITVSLLAVFIPILLMGGIVGRLFREFAVTLSIAIALSAVVSLTVTPVMCALLLGRQVHEHGALYRATERVFQSLVDAYDRSLTVVLRHPVVTLLVLAATIGFNVWLFTVVPWGFFPQQDTGQLMGFSDAPQDISFPAMRDRQEKLNKVVFSDPAVNHMISFIGSGPGGGALNTGTMFVELKPLDERKVSADEVIARLRPKLAKVDGVSLFLQPQQDVRIGGRFTRTQYQYTVEDANLDELKTWAPRIVQKLRTLPQLKDVATDQQTSGLQLDVTVDRDSAARLGLTLADVDGALYDAFGQRQVANIYTSSNTYRVVLEVLPELTRGPEALDAIHVRPSQGGGEPVPLSAIARWKPTATALSINHQSQFPSVTISFNLAPGIALGQAVPAIHRAELEIGLPASVHADFQGSAQAFQSSTATLPWLILFAIIAVYIVLGVLYESLMHPITILSTLPSAGVGALLALLAFRTELSLIALIGLILLIGIVKKNAIMMVDFAIEARRLEGKGPREAIHEACVLRFRPILMTTLAALLGGLPLALGHGIGSELRRPLGIAIVGGLAVSQVLTLFTTPVIYLVLDRLAALLRGDGREGPAATAP